MLLQYPFQAILISASSKPTPTVKLLYHQSLKNVPDFSIIGLQVSFPPASQSPPHRHGGASVMAIVISGTAYNKMNCSPTIKLSKGESWYEEPGCHHVTSANASDTEPLVLLATFVVETKVLVDGGPGALVVVDDEYKDIPIAVEM
jgi:quercetin dioxygenase-like cupin family protein